MRDLARRPRPDRFSSAGQGATRKAVLPNQCTVDRRPDCTTPTGQSGRIFVTELRPAGLTTQAAVPCGIWHGVRYLATVGLVQSRRSVTSPESAG
jgi:hypothetical protein